MFASFSASAESVNLVQGKTGFFRGVSYKPNIDLSGKPLTLATDGNDSTFNTVGYPDEKYNIYYDLGKTVTVYSSELSVVSYHVTCNVSYYDENFNLLKTYTGSTLVFGSGVKGLASGRVANVRYVSFGQARTDNKDFAKVTEFKVFGADTSISTIPEVSGLTVKPDVDKVELSWSNRSDADFIGASIYQDDVFLTTVDKSLNSYVVSGLERDKQYKFTVKSVDSAGRETIGVSKSTKTLNLIPVLKPPIVSVTAQNKSLIITWTSMDSPYFKGYNLYVNDQKISSDLLVNKLNLKGLENGKTYKIQVSTVNQKGIEGEKSLVVEGTPSNKVIEVEYDVKSPISVTDLLSSGFSLLWMLGPIIVLSIAILWFKPLKKLLDKAVKGRKDKK